MKVHVWSVNHPHYEARMLAMALAFAWHMGNGSTLTLI